MVELIQTPAAARSDHLPRGKARAHSRLVRVLRLVLPMIMLGVVVLLVVLVGVHAVRRHASGHKDASTPIRMLNPHFYGRDNQGRAYILGAQQAARDERSFQQVLLWYPTITQDVNGQHPSTLTADTGLYHEDTRILLLKGHVKANDAKASHFASDEAVVDTRTGTVKGPDALSSTSSMGDLQSKSFDVFDKGDRMVFKGGVHARLNKH
jgi:lipopolysaccharide export system protein LptC